MELKNLLIPPVLYHYTSWDTFEKIVKNHTWRFSSINGTNDLSEDLNLYVKQLLDDNDLISNINPNTKQNILNQIDTDNFIKRMFKPNGKAGYITELRHALGVEETTFKGTIDIAVKNYQRNSVLKRQDHLC